MNGTTPPVVFAALFTPAPFGRREDKSTPTPPRLLYIWDILEAVSNNSSTESPVFKTKQFDKDTGLPLPIPASTEPPGIIYLKSLNKS